MRPIVDDVEHRAIAALRHAVPEMEDSYLDLVDIYEDDVGADVVFGALADLVSDIVLGRTHDQTVLTRCLDLVESLAELGDPDADEIVAFSFLDLLPPGTLAAITSSLGEHTLGVLDRLESGDLGELPATPEPP